MASSVGSRLWAARERIVHQGCARTQRTHFHLTDQWHGLILSPDSMQRVRFEDLGEQGHVSGCGPRRHTRTPRAFAIGLPWRSFRDASLIAPLKLYASMAS